MSTIIHPNLLADFCSGALMFWTLFAPSPTTHSYGSVLSFDVPAPFGQPTRKSEIITEAVSVVSSPVRLSSPILSRSQTSHEPSQAHAVASSAANHCS
ncbi:uncharacterized protein LY89DRAFT_268294 [Mollisia scopiformis]|uniref:Uncharacterized protein n=1 Tax=Mollisia scopiformis TaxID=149040 RepID=A0A132BDW5_MOLSC|nr:uncharacterized protein LY89DRAFT_268294 [Mollisia scopiformis]KUJ10024.1 hypothetical protein LY89DRAFT_268294 [Mollisia scopiformis]